MKKKRNRKLNKTYAIFSDGDRHGTSSSNSSSLSSPSSPSSLPLILNDDDVNISGTGRIDGRLLPAEILKIQFTFLHWNHSWITYLSVGLKCLDSIDSDYYLMVILNDFLYSMNEVLLLQLVWRHLLFQWCLLDSVWIH